MALINGSYLKKERKKKKKEEEKSSFSYRAVPPDSRSLRFREGYKYLINDETPFPREKNQKEENISISSYRTYFLSSYRGGKDRE